MTKIEPFYLILSYLSAIILLIPVCIGIIRFRFIKEKHLLIFLSILISLFTEIISFILIKFFNQSNILLYNGYIIVETVLLFLYYLKYLENNLLKSITKFIAFIFVVVSVFEIIMNKKGAMSDISFTFESIFIIMLTIITFHYLIKSQIFSNILSAPIFWINSGLLLFFAGNLFLHLFSQILQEFAQKAFYELWGFHSILNIILYSLISIGFWKTKTSQI